MDKTIQNASIFRNIEQILYCAESKAEYKKESLAPFYYDPGKKIKLFHGDALGKEELQRENQI